MRQRILASLLVAGLVSALISPVLSVNAGPPEGLPPGQIERLEHGWKRVNPQTRVHRVGTEVKDNRKYGVYEAIFDSLPTTLDDNKTLIDTNWYLQTDISGQTWFQTGINQFTARVLEGRVSVEDENGRLSIWNPRVTIGGETFTGGTAKIANDPINEDYKGNCLLWEYGKYSSGWWVFGSSAKVERYLRVIEGHITEFWILPIDPKADVTISLNESVEENYGARIDWLNAYDANNRPLQVTKDKLGSYVISAVEFKDKVFPVIIDPTETFRASSDDGGVMYLGTSYATVRTRTTGTVYDTGGEGYLGQTFAGTTYQVFRFAAMWDTSAIPDGAVITTGKLYLTYSNDYSYTDFYVTIQSGMPTYPHKPLVTGDYYYTNYSGNGGQVHTSNPGYYIPLNSTGMSWINKTGWTKFMIRSSRDIAGDTPTQREYVTVRTREYGFLYSPSLYIAWTEPVDLPTVTTREASLVSSTGATLEGYLSDDGGESCSVRFQYGTNTSYGSTTAWVSGKTTGNYFNKTIFGLSPGTTYHFRAQAMNSAGTSSGTDKTFTTPPYAPTSFTATAGDGTVALTWSKGSGADKTMIRRDTSSYPTSPSSGTQIYFDTGTSHDDDTVVNNTTYYYSAWSEKSGVYSTTYVGDEATPKAPTDPTVTTNAATNVGTTTATLNLYLDDLGGYATTDVWFQYYKGAGTWTDNETTPTEKTAPGTHSAGISSLTTDTLYHMRAAAVNTHGTTYGADIPFTTNAPSAPTMTTQSATGVQLYSVTLNGVVTDDGDASCTVWFEWGLTTSYGGSTPTTSGLITDDIFYYGLGGLEPATTYHYRAVGQNTVGIGYGSDVEFVTTTPTAPTVRTDAASSIGANQAILNATILTDGDVECKVRFQYGLTDSYGTDTEWVEGYSAPQTFSKLIANLAVNETYHFRAQVNNAGGTGSGADAEFTTVFGAPTDFRGKAISATTINLSWGKTGDLTYIRYKTNGFPIDRADGDPVYNGPDEFTSISGLSAGTTYYFRAWSWREGDVWADNYAEDVATTQATVPPGEEELPAVVAHLDEPSWWYQTPSGTTLENTPFYAPVENVAEAYEIPSGGIWLLIAFTMSLGATIATYIGAGMASRGMGTKGKGFTSTIVGVVALFVCSWLGMLPLWYLLPFLLIALGVNFAIGKLGTGG